MTITSKERSSNSLQSLSGSSFTIYTIRISSSKMIFHSLRPIPVEGEYHLSTNDLCICGEIILGAADKIHVAFLSMEPLLRPFDLIFDGLRASLNKALLPLSLECLSAFSANAIDFLARSKTSWVSTMEVYLHRISSNLSISGHNALMLGLEPPDELQQS
jgi:hypothetical protein